MIWQACDGTGHITPLRGTLYRLVESQEQIATLGFVDTLEEQALLEAMLDQVKPPYPADCDDYHYLLKTPFRYPPLKWGSRFGRTHEPGIFYGGLSVSATLAEAAFYRFVFWCSMAAEPVKTTLRTAHTLFAVDYATLAGVRLHAAPFDSHRAELTDPQHYLPCQQLGSAMREAKVECFEYRSARSAEEAFCVGLFTPRAFDQKQPSAMHPWLCEVSANEVAFKQVGLPDITTFALDTFLVAGKLPIPAF
jgi:hypothetical protein